MAPCMLLVACGWVVGEAELGRTRRRRRRTRRRMEKRGRRVFIFIYLLVAIWVYLSCMNDMIAWGSFFYW